MALLLLVGGVSGTASTRVTVDQDNNFILNGRPFFPLGMNGGPPATLQWRDGTPGYEELVRGGINFFRTAYSASTWNPTDEAAFVAQLNECERVGNIYTYVSLRDLSFPLPEYPNRETELRRVISTYKNRAVLFWKSADEPAWGGVSIPGLIAGYNIIKQLDPDHPVLMNHAPRNTIEELRAYCVAADATGADIYPVSVPMGKNSHLPNKELSVVGDYTKRMIEVVYGKKPIVMVLQCTWSGVMPPNNVLIRPTFYQQRYMTWQSIICGAKGLAWFGWNMALSEEDAPYGWNWTYWVDVLKPLLEEIAAGSELNRVITAPSHDHTLGISGAGDVEYIARELDGRLYLLASKRESPTCAVTFSDLPKNAKAEVMFENRVLNVTNGSMTDTFDPNAVHLYRLFDPKMESDFNQDAVADPSTNSYPLPQGWSISSGLTNADKCHVVESSAEFASEPAEPTLARCVKFHDPANSAANAQLWRSFPAQQSGIATAQFDVRFRQTNAGFLFRVGNSGSVSVASSYAAHLIFEGATPWSAGGGPGVISYQTERGTPVYVNSGAKYEANKWYTVRVETDCTTKKFRIYFGLRGRPLKEITPYGGQPFITLPSTGEKVSSVEKLCFATASLSTDPEGVFYIDNVRVEGPLAMPGVRSDCARIRTAGKGSQVRLDDAIVTAGTDQLGGSFFYVQDEAAGGAGIRVRVSGVTVREGDRVSVLGVLQQASDNGITVRNNGEREILAWQTTVLSSGNATPPPVCVRCSDVGGGFCGDMEYIDSSSGSWPQLKGVWPYNNWGGGSSLFDPLANSYPPLFNVGTLVTVTGRVTKMCREYPTGHGGYDFYVDDGSLAHDGWFDTAAYGSESNHPRGVRVRMMSDIYPLPGYGDITGAIASVTGIAGAISSSNLVSNTGIRNVGLVRARDVARDIRIVR